MEVSRGSMKGSIIGDFLCSQMLNKMLSINQIDGTDAGSMRDKFGNSLVYLIAVLLIEKGELWERKKGFALE